jgi:DNA polymerase III subunit delta'
VPCTVSRSPIPDSRDAASRYYHAMLTRAIGHDDVRRWLANAASSRRVAGAYLFLGPDGIGKSIVAAEFAATLRCESRVDGWACGKCNECLRVERRVHPNVRHYAKPPDKTAFPVEQVREIVEDASLKRLEPGARVFVVADADRFNDSSANAFLKTLEEPPEGLTFVLLAGNAAQVLPTIQSRCQAVRFTPLDEDQLREATRGWEGLPVNPDSKEMLLRTAQGSPGRVRRLADVQALDKARDFIQRVSKDPFGASELLFAALTGDDNELKRAQLRDLLALLSAALRDRMVGALGAMDAKPLTRAIPEPTTGPDVPLAALQRLDDLRERVDGNANLKLACDAIALSWPQ